jgi:plasmid maintenance system killer protein
MVRQGPNGWFVYDRKRKGTANLGSRLAEKLTKEEASRIQQVLAAASEKRLDASRQD